MSFAQVSLNTESRPPARRLFEAIIFLLDFFILSPTYPEFLRIGSQCRCRGVFYRNRMSFHLLAPVKGFSGSHSLNWPYRGEQCPKFLAVYQWYYF
ncbi:hypothetical protein AYI69_g7150 [Smittium culicis]|uniref:Uncharacterized protein n=1 Tax=Smittium culicis TaxID=133412 RepID=A0A1R1XU22_9FUNG|nr:hypothetical protein AYI69_g7150 [Smittium culicis]